MELETLRELVEKADLGYEANSAAATLIELVLTLVAIAEAAQNLSYREAIGGDELDAALSALKDA